VSLGYYRLALFSSPFAIRHSPFAMPVVDEFGRAIPSLAAHDDPSSINFDGGRLYQGSRDFILGALSASRNGTGSNNKKRRNESNDDNEHARNPGTLAFAASSTTTLTAPSQLYTELGTPRGPTDRTGSTVQSAATSEASESRDRTTGSSDVPHSSHRLSHLPREASSADGSRPFPSNKGYYRDHSYKGRGNHSHHHHQPFHQQPLKHQLRQQPPTHQHLFKHPSLRYVAEPMLCQHIWTKSNDADSLKSKGTGRLDTSEVTNNNKEETEAAALPHEVDETSTVSQNIASVAELKLSVGEDLKPTPYDMYRQDYCTHYIRKFFNAHIDDSWFRDMYSPVCIQKSFERECQRAIVESTSIRDAIVRDVDTFLLDARLGNGVIVTATPGLLQHAPLSAPRKAFGPNDAIAPLHPSEMKNIAPPSHLFQIGSNALRICEIPHHVTDEHLSKALKSQCSLQTDVDWKLDISTSTPVSTGAPNNSHRSLEREAFVTCLAFPAALLDILRSLQQQNIAAAVPFRETTEDDSHIPRKNESDEGKNSSKHAHEWLRLEVECSDPYNRSEYDFDGYGGAPPDEYGSITPRKSIVRVRSVLGLPTPKVTVLSAALSVTHRIASDQRAAMHFARSLDQAKSIPTECSLDSIVEQIISSLSKQQRKSQDTNEKADNNMTLTELSECDKLDVAIAYLRRVHLMSFYHGCDLCTSTAADVWSCQHQASTIYLRLKDADEIVLDQLQSQKHKAHEESVDEDGSVTLDIVTELKNDLLVKRLDDSIAKALIDLDDPESARRKLISVSSDDVRVIATAEKDIEEQWLIDHSNVDEDGRARCLFHFCHKLFKDVSFLHKHLLKKHGNDFLKAAQAKAHDSFMMQAWESAEIRPVPNIAVDCGDIFGWVSVPVVGKIPMAHDPEPDLWREEEERQKQRLDVRRAQYRDRDPGRGYANHGPGNRDTEVRPKASTFVDVDDVQDESIMVDSGLLQDACIPVPSAGFVTTGATKKKKRKLL
jgi:hypothetical protein